MISAARALPAFPVHDRASALEVIGLFYGWPHALYGDLARCSTAWVMFVALAQLEASHQNRAEFPAVPMPDADQQAAPVRSVSILQWAAARNTSPSTARKWANAGQLVGAYRSGKLWILPENTPMPPDRLTGRPRGLRL